MAGTNVYGEMIRAQLQTSASDLTGPVTGLIYFNTTTLFPKWYNGSAWKTGVDSDTTQDLSNKTLISSLTFFKSSTGTNRRVQIDVDGATDSTTATLDFNQTVSRVYTFPDAALTVLGEANSATVTTKVISQCDVDGGTASNTARLTLPKASTATLSGLTRKEATLVYDTDTDKVYYDDGAALKAIGSGSGSGGKNYCADFSDGSTVGTVGTAIVTDTGNRASGLTAWQSTNTANISISSSATTPLRELSSYLTTGSGNAAAGSTFIETPAWQLDTVDLGKALLVQFDCSGNTTAADWDVCLVRYNSSGTYQEKLSVAGTASTGTPASAVIPTGTTTFRGFFVSSSTQTDYYALRFRRLAGTTNIRLDTLTVGPQSLGVGFAGQDTQTYTASYTGITATGTTYYSRAGEYIEVNGFVDATAAAATLLTVSLPSGLSIDATKITATQKNWLGMAVISGSGTGVYTSAVGLAVVYDSTDATKVYFAYQNASDGSGFAVGASQLANNLFSATSQMTFRFRAPIVGWASGVTMADRAVEEYVSNSNTANSNDTTSFAYGPYGSQYGSYSGGGVSKTCQFTTPFLPTDVIILENTGDSGVTWATVATNEVGGVSPYSLQNSVAYGFIITFTSATTARVTFGNYRYSNNTTYGGAGAAWSGIAGSDQYRWRIRKVAGGAMVGYPIDITNITGKFQYKSLSSNFSGTSPSTEATDLTFNNVVAGKTYRISVSGISNLANSRVWIQFGSGSDATKYIHHRTNPADAAFNFSRVFVSDGTPVKTYLGPSGSVFVASDFGETPAALTGGAPKATWATLEELPVAVTTVYT